MDTFPFSILSAQDFKSRGTQKIGFFFYKENIVRKILLQHAYKQSRLSYLTASSRSEKWVRVLIWNKNFSDLIEIILRTWSMHRFSWHPYPRDSSDLHFFSEQVCSTEAVLRINTLPDFTLFSLCLLKHLCQHTIHSWKYVLEFLE